MARRKFSCFKWTLVLIVVLICPLVYSRPQESSSSRISAPTTSDSNKPTENPTRTTGQPTVKESTPSPSPTEANSSRNVKTKSPVLRDSIKMVASQLLETNATSDSTIVTDTRTPPKLKTKVEKHKIKTRNEDNHEKVENSHAGIAVPITMEELETENKITEVSSESSTSNEGISTWILLSNPAAKENSSASTEPTKIEEVPKKKPSAVKNKTKRPQQTVTKAPSKRPIIGSINKSDLIAGGSAINANVLNKIKDTVMTNVQKNKSTTQKVTSTTTTTTLAPSTVKEVATTKKEELTKPSSSVVAKVTPKPTKKKNKNKIKVSTTTTEEPFINESAMLPMEAKEQEIELEISTPATSTKKPKRNSNKRKKNKTKKRKTRPSKTEESSLTEVKTSNKTKSAKPSKKQPESAISTQIFSYLSREVMPSVGVGMIGLAGLVGIASYFLYPFASPVRRTFEVDKKDDIYRHNAEEYASEGNGQAEEEMLGTVLAGMPAHSKHKLNPYMGQMAHTNRYPAKIEQDSKYRNVAAGYESPNYNTHYPQQKTGIAHAAVYSEPAKYSPHKYETRHVYTTESYPQQYAYEKPSSETQPQQPQQYTYEKSSGGFETTYSAAEPIYSAPQTGPSDASAWGNEAANTVVYGVKPSAETDFKPVYPFEGQVFSDTTSNPITYPPTSMYLGSNNEADQPEQLQENQRADSMEGGIDNKFVVGNVPKELSETATAAVVPEHGPRNLNRRKRSILNKKRSITGTIEEVLKAAKIDNKDIFISNEIDEALGVTNKVMQLESMAMVSSDTNPGSKPTASDVSEITKEYSEITMTYPVHAVTADSENQEKVTSTDVPTTSLDEKIIESVSTIPLELSTPEKTSTTSESDISNELDFTTKPFRVYEVFSSPTTKTAEESSPLIKEEIPKEVVTETTTELNRVTETTTELRSETTSTMPPLSTPTETKLPSVEATVKPKPTTDNPNVITYPPLNSEGSFFTFLKRLVEFKYRLGLSILQSTSESLNRYLRNMDDTVQKVAKGSY